MTIEYGQAATLFAHERQQLLAACRHLTEGGVLEEVIHVGASSIPGLPPSATIELAAAVWPFPPTAATLATLAELGYVPVNEGGLPVADGAFLHLRHHTALFQLYLWRVGANGWFDLRFVGDYLRQDPAGRRQFVQTLLAPCPESALVTAARDWYVQQYGFAALYAFTDELRDFAAPWYISSGWALDLFLGEVTRCHADVDVVVARQDQLLLQTYLPERGWRFVTYLEGKPDPWPLHMRLELPRYQVHAHRDGMMLDILFTDIRDGVWRYRREPSIIQSVERMSLQSAAGIWFLAPELVLLFKSRNTGNTDRSKDQTDFDMVYPRLNTARRTWLRWALLTLSPDHAWLPLLT